MDAKSGETAAVATTPITAAVTEKALPAPADAIGSAARFDGTWSVRNRCTPSADGAQGFTYVFAAQVKDGYLRGDRLTEGSAGWLRVEGQIQPDGSARLSARGLTHDPKHSVKGLSLGAPFGYQIAARFEGASGSGKRLELPPCEMRFTKQ